nr:acyltransferase [Acidimicrobiia bacterium]
IGVRSYSLYLWHWPIFVFTRPGLDQPLGLYPTLAVRLVLTVIAAELSYRYVEVPIRSGAIGRWRARLAAAGDRRRQVSPIAFAGAAAVLLVAVSTLGAGESRGEQLLVGQSVVPPAGAVVAAAGLRAATTVPQQRAGAQPGDTITVLGDSVLLGAEEQMRSEFAASGYGVDYRVEPAWMLDNAGDEIAAQGQRVGSTVVINLGHNTLWERDRANFDTWAGEFDEDADELLATLRQLGAERFVWINMGVPDRSLVPEMGQRQYDLYLWYFPYVNERLDALVARHSDVVLADWAASSNQPGLTYDAMHLTGDGIRLMIDTVRSAGGI